MQNKSLGHPPWRIGVIGAGISGLSAAWLLSRRHHVTVFESRATLGGHSNTVMVPFKDGTIAVDTGFIVYNEVNYPNLVALFQVLGVDTVATDMSFSVSINDGAFEYAGSTLNGLFAQRRNVFRPRFWRMIGDLRRFYRSSPQLLAEDGTGPSLGAYLAQENYSTTFVHDHLLPMAAAIWSTPADKMLAYPAKSFVRFCENHGLLRFKDRPEWRTLRGGACTYVERLAAAISGPLRTGRAVKAILRESGGVRVVEDNGRTEHFDQVVIATHADEALRMLADPDEAESAVLGAFTYQPNRAVLHSDQSVMPHRRAAWASWNYLAERGAEGSGTLSVTYWMNRLQPIGARLPLFVTLNPGRAPAPALTHADFLYTHPVFNADTEIAKKKLWTLQGRRNTWFCGAYFGWGFHEDGVQAGLAVAEDLGGVARPWQVDRKSDRVGRPPIANAPTMPEAA